MSRTATLLGTLRVEATDDNQPDGTGSPNRIRLQPAGTPLRNDGVWRHWMTRGCTYRLAHDGVGWHVTCPTWTGRAHVYRLVEAQDLQWADMLPTDAGAVLLDRNTVYELREREPWGSWELYAL